MPLLFLDNWFNNAFIQALGWTLFHSLWQGFLLVVLVSLAIVLTKRSTATVRYGIFSSLFFIFIGVTLCTFIIEFSSLRSIPTPSLLTGNEIGDTLTLSTNTHTAAVDLKVPLPGRLAFYFNEYGPWLMLLWFIVFTLKSIRLGINYAQVQRIRNEKPYVLPAIEKRVNELAKLLRIRRKVILRETTSISVPVTIGFLKPLILIPCGLINNLPPDQVEAILLHELAHIRRADYLVNLLQCMAETVFFFNPAVLWLSSLMREERENCCDDIAITVTQNKSLFIHALVAFQEYHAGHPIAPGLSGNKYPLLKRIQRIVYNNNKKLNHMEKIFLAAGLVVTGIVALAFTNPSSNKKTDADVSIGQKFQPAYNVLKDSVPEHRIMNGSINSVIDGKKYKVIVRDDKPVDLYIDGERIPENELEAHHQTMEKIMEEGRDNFFKARQRDEEAKKLMDLYQGQKRDEEAILLEKLFKEQDQQKFLTDLEARADIERKMNLFQDDQKENELFNQQKKMELQDKFLKELQNDKILTDLRTEKFMKDLQYDKEAKVLFDKLNKGGEEERLRKEYMQLLEKVKNSSNKNEADRQFQLQRDQMQFEKMLQLYQDTSKPGKVDVKRKVDKEDADADSDARRREGEEYRAMMAKEREKYRKELDKEREKYRKEMEEKRKEMQKEREKDMKEMEKEREKNKREMNEEREAKMKEMQKEREKYRKEMDQKRKEMEKDGDEDSKVMEKEKRQKMKEMQNDRENDRREMQEEREKKMKEMQRDRENDRREMQEEREKKMKEMQKDRENDRREMEEERRKEERRKEETERKKETRDDKNGDDKVTRVGYHSKEETRFVNKDGKDNLDYKWEAKGFTAGKDDNLKFDKDGDDKGKLFLNKPRTGNERIAAKRAESEARMKEHNERRNAMLSELKDDGIVPKDATEFSIHINDQEMVVNGVKQPQNVFNKYREKIRKNAGKPSPPNPAVSPVIKVSPSTYNAPPIKFGPTIKIHPDIKLDPVLKKALAKRQFTYSKPATNASKTT